MFGKLTSNTLLKECYATFVLNHGVILTGLTLSFPACLIPQLKKEGYDMNIFVESMLASITPFVTGITTFITIFLIGSTSRKRMSQISLIVFATGAIVILFSTNTTMLCIGLVVQSSVVSIFVPVFMTYVSEICRKEHRGTLLSTMCTSYTSGVSLTYILNSIVTWKMLMIITLLIAASEFLQTFLIPESNFWYLQRGENELAKASILWFEPTLNAAQLNERIRTTSDATDSNDCAKNGQFFGCVLSVREKAYLRPLLIGTLISIFRSGNGRTVIGVHIESTLQNLGMPYSISDLIRWFGILELLGSIFILFFMHKIKRKTLMMAGTIVLELSLAAIVVYKFSQGTGFQVPGWLPTVGFFAYIVCVTTSYNSILSIITSEIQAPVYRPQMNLFLNGIIFLMCSLHCFFFPYALKIVRIQYIIVYFMSSIAFTLFLILCLVPETSKMEFYENENKSAPKSSGHDVATINS